MNKSFVIENLQTSERLDKYLANELSDFSRTHIAKLIEEGNVLVNDKIAKGSLKIKSGDKIDLSFPEVKELEIKFKEW